MRKSISKTAFAAFFLFGISFAQEATPEKLAVYTFGASDAGVNKSLSSKLLAAMTSSGTYTEIGDPNSFQDELAKSGKSDLASIVQTAKRYGSDYVCAVSITEVFGTHSINARIIKIAGSQVVKTGGADRSLKSLEDLTAVSNELARQLLPPSAAALVPAVAVATPAAPAATATPAAAYPAKVAPQPVAKPPAVNSAAPYAFLASGSFGDDVASPQYGAPVAVSPSPAPAPVINNMPVDRVAAAQAAAQKQCAKTYNINELLFKIKDGFPAKLKDCSKTLAKDMLNPFGKKLEPKSFMMQCPIDGIKNELPDGFPNTDKILGGLTNFVQGLMNSALAGGSLDPKKLVSAVGSMDIEGLLSDVKKLASGPCVVNEPYEPAASDSSDDYAENDSDEEDGKSAMSFGIRAGLNYSHVVGDGGEGYRMESHGGMQLGFVVDFALTSLFHIQPGLMYIQKGTESLTAHYLELPLLLSLKFYALRINAGPYFGLCVEGGKGASDTDNDIDIGLNLGLGFDIGMFYIGAFIEESLMGVYGKGFNETIGFNLGVNL